MNAITRRQSAETPARAPTRPRPCPSAPRPHNLEAEQALLGAILVNNEAHDRVSGFLEPHHFYDPLHQQIYETPSKLIASGKQATPITLRTFFETAEPIDATLDRAAVSGPARRQRHHHHQRARLRPHHPRPRHPPPADRDRRGHGQRGLRLARSTSRPRSRSRRPRRGCSRWPRPDKYGQGFLAFNTALTTAIEMAGNAYQRDGRPLRHRHRASRSSTARWAACSRPT